MKEREGKSNLSGLLVLVLFVVFAMCVLSVLLTGADVYQRLARRDQESYDRRTVTQYITTKVRQGDVSGQIFVGPFDAQEGQQQGDTLFLVEENEGEPYCTRFYCFDGSLRELFSDAGGEFQPEDGERILNVQELFFSLEDNFLTVEICYETGEYEYMKLSLRSEEAVE